MAASPYQPSSVYFAQSTQGERFGKSARRCTKCRTRNTAATKRKIAGSNRRAMPLPLSVLCVVLFPSYLIVASPQLTCSDTVRFCVAEQANVSVFLLGYTCPTSSRCCKGRGHTYGRLRHLPQAHVTHPRRGIPSLDGWRALSIAMVLALHSLQGIHFRLASHTANTLIYSLANGAMGVRGGLHLVLLIRAACPS